MKQGKVKKITIGAIAFLLAVVLIVVLCRTREGSFFDPETTAEQKTEECMATTAAPATGSAPSVSLSAPTAEPEEFRGFWLTYSEIKSLAAPDADAFYQNLYERFSLLSQNGLNTVIFHARAFADAFYASSIFPWSVYASGTQGVSPGYDMLAVAVRAAHDCSLKIHAWINPYRVSYDTDIQALSDSNPAKQMYVSGETDQLLLPESGIYFDPSSPRVQKLVIDGIREIAANYDVDGIHIDDYFYPSDVGDCDSSRYLAYTQSGGTLSLGDWRRSNVNALVSGIYSAVKAIDPSLVFGISPGGVPETNFSTYYADVSHWATTPGYCDYLIPQIYFGFLNKNYGYERLLSYWTQLCQGGTVELYIGLALYKTGDSESYAGSDEGRSEFTDHADVIKRQVESLRAEGTAKGFAVFSFGDMTKPDVNEIKKSEVSNLFSIL